MTSKFPKTPALNVSVSHREIPSAPGAGASHAIIFISLRTTEPFSLSKTPTLSVKSPKNS